MPAFRSAPALNLVSRAVAGLRKLGTAIGRGDRGTGSRPQLEAAGALMRIVSSVDDYLYANEHFADGTRRSVYAGPNRERLMGGSVPAGRDTAREWERLIHPDDWNAHLAHRERLRAGEPSEVRYRLVGYDGVIRWAHARTKPQHVDGRLYVDGIVSDVTHQMEQKQRLEEAQAELRQLAEINEYQALHDALTGLGNRRKLLADLEAVFETPAYAAGTLLVLLDLDGFKQYNDRFGHPAGDALLKRLATKLNSLIGAGDGESYRLGGDEFCVLVGLHGNEDVEAKLALLAQTLSDEGEGFNVTSSFGAVFLPAEAGDPSAALHIADSRLYAEKRTRYSLRGRPHEMLLQALAERQPDLRTHTTEVAILALALAEHLDLDADLKGRVEEAALMHDVGKIAVPDTILQKPGPLDEDEWTLIRQHTVIGERIVGAAPALRHVASIVRSTHERFDGTGYPDGLREDEIPIEARIVSVCDAYSAMTRDRPYGPPKTPSAALAEVVSCAGTQFDPAVVHALQAVMAARDENRLDPPVSINTEAIEPYRRSS
jgi:diguanylate cyclase (GGDEF)-like protein/putative nucleotidyltransferase with HDIG domain